MESIESPKGKKRSHDEDSEEKPEASYNLGVGSWNVQGKATFTFKGLRAFCTGAGLDVLFVHEPSSALVDEGDSSSNGFSMKVLSIQAGGRESKRGGRLVSGQGAHLDNCVLIYRQERVTVDVAVVDVSPGDRQCVVVRIIRRCATLYAITMHAPFQDGGKDNSAAIGYMQKVVKYMEQEKIDILIGDTNLYGGRQGSSRARGFQGQLKAIDIKGTTASGSTLDRAMYLPGPVFSESGHQGDLIHKACKDESIMTGLLGPTDRPRRKIAVRQRLSTVSSSADHFGIYAIFSLTCCGEHGHELGWDEELEAAGDEVAGADVTVENIRRVPCLRQIHNTCGPRAVHNALVLAGVHTNLLDPDELRNVPFGVDVHGGQIRNELNDRGGDAIAVLENAEHLTTMMGDAEAAVDDGDHALLDFIHARSNHAVVVLNVLFDTHPQDIIGQEELVGHYIAVRLERQQNGQIVAVFADSLPGNSGFASVQQLIETIVLGALPSDPKKSRTVSEEEPEET